MDITIKTQYTNGTEIFDRNVTIWLNKDGSVSLLGNLEHGTHIIINQKLVDDLQRMVYAVKDVR